MLADVQLIKCTEDLQCVWLCADCEELTVEVRLLQGHLCLLFLLKQQNKATPENTHTHRHTLRNIMQLVLCMRCGLPSAVIGVQVTVRRNSQLDQDW